MIKNDLTQGNIWKKLILYFVPLAIGTFFQQLYNAIDGLVVGKYVGTIALAAVGGSASLVSMALVNFFVGVLFQVLYNMGAGILRAVGDSKSPFIIIAVSVCLFRLIWLKFVFSAYPTLKCLSSCYPVSWTLTSSGMAVYYLIHIKHKTVVK